MNRVWPRLNSRPKRSVHVLTFPYLREHAGVVSPMAGRLKYQCFESLSQPAELNRGERTRDESPARRC
jgi:hypothetical protein